MLDSIPEDRKATVYKTEKGLPSLEHMVKIWRWKISN